MKKFILALVILAVAAIFAYKFVGSRTDTTNANVAVVTASPQTNTQPATDARKVLYLFHDPSDQDSGCRAIYAFADDAEKNLLGKVKVERPDVKKEKALIDKYKVKVLPTILIASADGTEQERFEGEGPQVSSRIKDALAKLK